MALFLYALSFLFNFLYGVLLPIVPHLNQEDAGWAFTAFLLCKLLWLLPAGYVSDRIGHGAALTLTLLIQTLALLTIALLPASPWFGRALEGMALAQGTLSTFACLRVILPDPDSFRASVSKLMGLGGLGMIIGPMIGYQLLPFGAERAVLSLAALNSVFLVVQFFFFRRAPRAAAANAVAGGAPTPKGSLVWFALGLTAAKAVAVGWEPNLAWWAQETLGFGAETAGMSFFVLGLAFVLGSFKPIAKLTPLVFLGFAALELSLHSTPMAWWPALATLGFWYGIYVTISMGRLGWNDPEKIGRHNSIWMLGTDLPMAFVPAVLWNWREPEWSAYRWSLGLFFLAIASFSLFYGLARDSRAPTRSSRS